ncbi:MAG: class I SAM-dependent methyltransferase [Gammaproteobacteria bacterium]
MCLPIRKFAFGLALMAALAPAQGQFQPDREDLAVPYRFSDAERWVPVFEDPARAEWQMTGKLMDALGVEPGMSTADIGAGSGYITRPLARAVGERGRVFAVDIELSLLTALMRRAEAEGLDNIVPTFAAPHAPRLQAECCDLVLFSTSYHMIAERVDYVARLAPMLKPGGRIAVLSWRKEITGDGPPVEYRLDGQAIREEFRQAGFERVAEFGFLPQQLLQIFAPVP